MLIMIVSLYFAEDLDGKACLFQSSNKQTKENVKNDVLQRVNKK